MAKFQKKTVVEVVLYISRGRQDGRELEDWLAAERELTAHGREKDTK